MMTVDSLKFSVEKWDLNGWHLQYVNADKGERGIIVYECILKAGPFSFHLLPDGKVEPSRASMRKYGYQNCKSAIITVIGGDKVELGCEEKGDSERLVV